MVRNSAGFWKGQPADPDSVKFKVDFQGIEIHVDRPKGFIMRGTDDKGRDWARRYQYDYGFIPKTLGGDGDGLDVFLGPDKKAPEAFWAIQRKADGSFDEYKVFLGFKSREAAIATYRDHIPKKFFKGIVSMKVEMMKSMLGLEPKQSIKTAQLNGFFDEISWIAKTSMPDVLTRVLGGAALGALGGLGYHGLKEMTPAVKNVAWAQNLANDGEDIAVGGSGPEAMEVISRMVSARRAGESPVRRGAALYAEVPTTARDVAGRAAPVGAVVDARRGGAEKALRDLVAATGRTVDEERFAQEIMPSVRVADKPWYLR